MDVNDIILMSCRVTELQGAGRIDKSNVPLVMVYGHNSLGAS